MIQFTVIANDSILLKNLIFKDSDVDKVRELFRLYYSTQKRGQTNAAELKRLLSSITLDKNATIDVFYRMQSYVYSYLSIFIKSKDYDDIDTLISHLEHMSTTELQ